MQTSLRARLCLTWLPRNCKPACMVLLVKATPHKPPLRWNNINIDALQSTQYILRRSNCYSDPRWGPPLSMQNDCDARIIVASVQRAGWMDYYCPSIHPYADLTRDIQPTETSGATASETGSFVTFTLLLSVRVLFSMFLQSDQLVGDGVKPACSQAPCTATGGSADCLFAVKKVRST